MDRLKRLREPAAWVGLVGLGLNLAVLLALAAFDGLEGSLAAGNLAAALASPVLVLLVAGLVAACWAAEVTPHARGLTVAALTLTALTLTLALGFGILGLVRASADDRLSVVPYWALPPLVVGVVAVAALIALLGRPAPAYAPPSLPAAPVAANPEPDPQLQPSWTHDTAVGAVWRRAGDAGSEGPATSWEAPGEAHPWWGPAPNQELPAATPRPDEQ